MAENYYDILGVLKGASQDEIKKAFRKKAHELHPDKKTGDEKKFKEANEAYQVLSDPQKRQQYDQFGQTFSGAGSQGGGFGGGQGFGGFDFSGFDFGSAQGFGGFEDVFGDLFGGSRRRTRRGTDIQIDVEVSLFEAAKGVIRKVPLRRKVTCSVCSGTGGKPGSREETCKTCNGRGQVQKLMKTLLGTFQQTAPCDGCQGKGKTYNEQCSACHGDGRTYQEEMLDIQVPAGIEEGQALSMSGKGEAGESGAPSGDLVVLVHVRPEKGIERRGSTLYSERIIRITEATLGASITVETIEGEVTMKVPAGTQPGEVFRLRGKGMPTLHSHHRGDHMVTIRVAMPKKLSKKAKEALETLQGEGM
jgi:molecular chaperone DnaJ